MAQLLQLNKNSISCCCVASQKTDPLLFPISPLFRPFPELFIPPALGWSFRSECQAWRHVRCWYPTDSPRKSHVRSCQFYSLWWKMARYHSYCCHCIIVEGICGLSSLCAIICSSLFLPSGLSYQKLCLCLVVCSEESLLDYPASVCLHVLFIF